MTYEEWLESRRYRVICNRRVPEPHTAHAHTENTTVASGLRLEHANVLCKKLNAEEDKKQPHRSSWTCDLYLYELETPKWDPKMRTE